MEENEEEEREENGESSKYEVEKEINTKEKQPTQILISQEENISQNSEMNERTNELEQENKTLKREGKEMREALKNKKKDIEHREKQLKDRKNEAARLHKTNEENRREITTWEHKYEILQKQKEVLEQAIQKEKSSWNELLSTELQQEYKKSENYKMTTDEMNRKMQMQYTAMIGEKDNIIKEKEMEVRKSKAQVEQLKIWLKEGEKNTELIQEKTECISKLEKRCEALNKNNETLQTAHMKLEEEIYKKAKTLENMSSQSNITEINKGEGNQEANSTTDNDKEHGVKQKESNNTRMESNGNSYKATENQNQEGITGDRNQRETLENTGEKKGVLNAVQKDKTCFACGERSHEIKNCNKKQNIFVRFKGERRINGYVLEEEFGKYGKIQAKRIKRDKEGNYTKTAMICFQSEGEARNAVERMKASNDWVVDYFTSTTSISKIRTNKGEDNQKRGEWKGEGHWSVQHPNFFNTKPNFRGETRTRDQNERRDVREEIDSMKEEVRSLSNEVKRLITFTVNSNA